MADKTGIEWTDATWTIVQGCDYESPGCKHCYVPPMLWRLMHNPNPKISAPLQGLVEIRSDRPVFTGKVAMREDRLNWPLTWKSPRRIFVPSHGDIFHEAVTDAFLDQIFAVMALCPQHTFQVLTKRAGRMREYLEAAIGRIADAIQPLRTDKEAVGPVPHLMGGDTWWPLPNVWLGVSVEDQVRAEERIPMLLETPAAKRFLSGEPLLEQLDLARWLELGGVNTDRGLSNPGIDWVIAGGESGEDARPMHPDWARSLRDQCQAADVPFFFKQWGSCLPGNMDGEDERGRAAYEIDEEHSSIDYDDLGKGREIFEHGTSFIRFPHKNTGRRLDGREWSEFPK